VFIDFTQISGSHPKQRREGLDSSASVGMTDQSPRKNRQAISGCWGQAEMVRQFKIKLRHSGRQPCYQHWILGCLFQNLLTGLFPKTFLMDKSISTIAPL